MGNLCPPTTHSSDSEKLPDVDEAELVVCVSETMSRSNLEDIKSRFANLLIEMKSALEANHVATNDVRSILVGMFPGSDPYIPKTNLEEIFDAASRHDLWNYWHHSPVEKLLCRCLPDHVSLIREYKEHLSGFCTTTKLIDYIKYTNIDPGEGCNELPLGSYTKEQCKKLMVTLDIKRNITTISLKYVQDLWERFAEEFDIPFLTAVIDSIVTGSLIITWLVPPDVAEKIAASAYKSTPFFEEHHIMSVTIAVYGDKSHTTLREKVAEDLELERRERKTTFQAQRSQYTNPRSRSLTFGDLAAAKPGPLPFKRSRLEDAQHSTDGTSTAGPSSASGLDTKLSFASHFEVCSSLKLLDDNQVLSVGGALGLSFNVLRRMKSLPDEMVAAWLRREAYVVEDPTWRELVTALRRVGQEGVAETIENDKRLLI